jgi:hypothetical protein
MVIWDSQIKRVRPRFDLLERADERFHFGFLPNRPTHVIWIGREQAADGDVYLTSLARRAPDSC